VSSDLASYVLDLLRNWWFRAFAFLSLISTAITFYVLFRPGFLLPKAVPIVTSLLALLISPYDVYKRQQARIRELLKENALLKEPRKTSLADLISELDENLGKASAPTMDQCAASGGIYVRPSTERWKAVRNVIQLDAQLRDRLARTYEEVDRWRSIVDSGVKPAMGSPDLDRIVARLRTQVPGLLEELRKLQGA